MLINSVYLDPLNTKKENNVGNCFIYFSLEKRLDYIIDY